MKFIVFALAPFLMLAMATALLTWWGRIFARPSQAMEEKATRFGDIATLFFLGWIVIVTIMQGQVPVLNWGQMLVFLAVLIWTEQSYLQHRVRQRILVILPLTVMTLLFGLGIVFGVKMANPAASNLAGGMTGMHMIISMAGTAMLLGSGVYGFGQLTLYRDIKKRNFGKWFTYLPPLEDMDRLRTMTLLSGWTLLTVSLVVAMLQLFFGQREQGAIISHMHPMLTLWTILTLLVAANRFNWLGRKKLALGSVLLSTLMLVLLIISLVEIFGVGRA